MAKIVFFCIPAYGHTNPTLGVVRELVHREHTVYYYSFDAFKDMIEETGAYYKSCDKYSHVLDEKNFNADRITKNIVYSIQLLVNVTLSMDEQIEKDMRKIKPDVIVSDSVAYWGKLIAFKMKIPFVSSTTTFAFNKKSAAIMKPSTKEMIKMLFDLPKTKKILKPLRDKGYPAKNFLSIVQNDNTTTTIVYTSKMFQPYSDSFSDKYTFVGAIPKKPKEDFKKIKDHLVYISLGTVNNKHPEFYKNCIEALKDSNYQVVISVGKDTDISAFTNVPKHIHVYPFVDQGAVLNKANVFVSHCGMNSASESMYYGVPLVLFPQTTEQQGVANRVEELGAGKRLSNSQAKTIRQAVDTVISNGIYRERAAKIGDSLKNCSGAAGAADVIERQIGLV